MGRSNLVSNPPPSPTRLELHVDNYVTVCSEIIPQEKLKERQTPDEVASTGLGKPILTHFQLWCVARASTVCAGDSEARTPIADHSLVPSCSLYNRRVRPRNSPCLRHACSQRDRSPFSFLGSPLMRLSPLWSPQPFPFRSNDAAGGASGAPLGKTSGCSASSPPPRPGQAHPGRMAPANGATIIGSRFKQTATQESDSRPLTPESYIDFDGLAV